ncbi:biotin-dependent carboxyltransferase family protein [Asanoa sp. WMMD1127]|uniref:5-oxoprolinase subunit C family protein n=1 Tax=Asanoa sp. WMMD1127 TaxID=3016107 RepID=UPI00241681B1|nr:biotin-dependent carboxyltransferase family protein [Asanoa sp. WMMD1127]MDG4822280.1 biotin-dependent carboxyltransferase family protein [Asanoa sp. WMMD1127]
MRVVRAGALTTVQDLGRPGYAHLGVPRSGALDGPALRRANALVGNPPGAAGLETTLTGCAFRLVADGTIAVTGATARVRVDGAEVGPDEAVEVPAGALVDVGRATAGVRSYVAVAGGLDVPPVLGSRSTDTLSGLGPPRLRDGDLLRVGSPVGAVARLKATPPAPAEIVLPVVLGPRHDWFTAEAVETLLTTAYAVSPQSNRVGARLAGAALARADAGELPSEGVVLGAVQVPADGQPLVFLADHPTTGGYPVIAVVTDVTALAQARPGSTVRFHGPER